jgi:hypothetical protein
MVKDKFNDMFMENIIIPQASQNNSYSYALCPYHRLTSSIADVRGEVEIQFATMQIKIFSFMACCFLPWLTSL